MKANIKAVLIMLKQLNTLPKRCILKERNQNDYRAVDKVVVDEESQLFIPSETSWSSKTL